MENTNTASDGAGLAADKEKALKGLAEHLDEHNENRKEIQEKLHMVCEDQRKNL